MGELAIRRTRGFAVPQYQSVTKGEKQTGTGSIQGRKTAGTPGYTVSETLQQLMTKVGQAKSQIRDSRRTLQTGETVLDEVQDSLARMKELAQKAAGGGNPDRAALQAELEQLRTNIDRMLSTASVGGTRLFLDEDTGIEEGVQALLDALMNDTSAKQEVPSLPNWLTRSLTQDVPSTTQLLAALGLDQRASGAELLAAVTGRSLESDPAAGYLATLYLGAVIAGGDPSGQLDPQQAMNGIQQLLEKTAEGVPLDQAIEELTNGEFTSLADFQAQFTSGTAPGLQDFLVGLLLAESEPLLALDSPLLALLAGMEGANFDLLMGLLTVGETAPASSSGTGPDPGAPAAPEQGATQAAAPQTSTLSAGTVQVMGQDLSGVSVHETTGELTVAGTADVVIQGTAQSGQTIHITGSGAVTLQNVRDAALIIDSAAARLVSAGQNTLAQVVLREGTSLTISGGLLKIGLFQANQSNLLRLTGGAAVIEGEDQEGGVSKAITATVLLDGAVSLAAQAENVRSFSGTQLEPFDLVWKALLPGWSSLTSLSVDGKQARMSLLGGELPDPARLWLDKGDASHGYAIHTLIARGRDQLGRLQARYAYLRWSQSAKAFQTLSMYPNPFRVVGGEAGQDWDYDEESHTLHILSAQVTAISGGRGRDAEQIPFSGRIVLADRIGSMSLALGGVVCRVSSGRALDLGQENNVTLLLQGGTDNRFEGGTGCAGISLGEGTTLCVDRAKSHDDQIPVGTLTAIGNAGGAGIGRDSGAGQDQDGHILIRGGTVTAVGSGGGAGIGAGKHSGIGPIIITGGTISAEAGYHAAAIGAGVHGLCGDILISGTARVVKALGGDPGADIGACLFGTCGEVQISDGADIGSAQLRRKSGLLLQTGEQPMTLPQFCLSSRTLQLDKLNVTTRENARSAKLAIGADQRWVAQIQEAYSALYGRLEESFGGLYTFRQYISLPEEPVRDNAAASSLLQDMMLQPDQVVRTHSRRGAEDVTQLLQ